MTAKLNIGNRRVIYKGAETLYEILIQDGCFVGFEAEIAVSSTKELVALNNVFEIVNSD